MPDLAFETLVAPILTPTGQYPWQMHIMSVMADICRCPDLLPRDRDPVSVTLEVLIPQGKPVLWRMCARPCGVWVPVRCLHVVGACKI